MERFERAEEAAEAREHFARHAAILVAIIAALLTIAALAAERASEEILLTQAQASDTYNELEANSLKKHTDGNAAAELRILAPNNPAAKALADKLQKGVDTKYGPNEDKLLPKAKALEEERDSAQDHHTVMQWAEGAFQLAIVLTSIAIVARSGMLVLGGLGVGIVGILLLIDGFTLFIKIGSHTATEAVLKLTGTG